MIMFKEHFLIKNIFYQIIIKIPLYVENIALHFCRAQIKKEIGTAFE